MMPIPLKIGFPHFCNGDILFPFLSFECPFFFFFFSPNILSRLSSPSGASLRRKALSWSPAKRAESTLPVALVAIMRKTARYSSPF
ncbi:hypothetical protein CEXT_417551 [Caerostris extrusa]|uniref:Uncharacterized protein n=1 Tax=Caerostris extrusa TaxID=172846 RepID=A0AAV4SPQ8_CAEEX|nr:hypothetical protein CEXT_417551 [Caerostris extrusa]